MKLFAFLTIFFTQMSYAQFTASDLYYCQDLVSSNWEKIRLSRFPKTVKNGVRIRLIPLNSTHYYYITCNEKGAFSCVGHSTRDYKSFKFTGTLRETTSQALEVDISSSEIPIRFKLRCLL